MPDVRAIFLDSAAAAVDTFADPAVAAAWDRDSVLEGMTVGALVAHAARALSTVRRYLGGEAPPHDAPHFDAPGYILSVLPDTDRTSDTNRAVLDRAVAAAESGRDAVVREAADDLDALRRTLPHLSERHILAVLDGVVLLLDEYLTTRIVELVVHHDDIEASVEEATRRELPDQAGAVAVGILAEVARRRTSTTAMITALSRRERVDGEPPRAL